MLYIEILLVLILIPSALTSRLKYRSYVKENVDLYYTITSLDQMLDVDYQHSIEFLNPNAPYTTYFLVDGQKLRSSRLIDREEFCRIRLCENSRCYPCEIEMDFVLKEHGQSRDILSLILTVEDVNEFRPQFVDQNIELKISEGVPVGHILPLPSATDLDGEEEDLTYSIDKSEKIPFDLISFGSNQIALNVTESLDRESQDFYELRLTSSDRGNLSTTINLRISISDINDNVPVFLPSMSHVIRLSENTLPSLTQSIARIQAVDLDAGENGRISYNFGSQVAESIPQTFHLNSQTGELFLIRSLDFEKVKEYRIQITAQDAGPVSVPVYTTVVVYVEDENDNKPIINLRVSEYFHFINNVLYVSEQTPVNTLLMHVLVQDIDSSSNGEVRCWIESSEKFLFNITNNIQQMFAVYTGQMFDREHQANYSLSIIVEDQGIKIRHRSVRRIQLVVTDINDCSPKFSQSIYKVDVHENEEYKQAVIRFVATDDDLNENGQIYYELIGNEYPTLFDLDRHTGELFVRQTLDREIQAAYNFTVRARDLGVDPRSLFTDVQCLVEVLDKNEFIPVFERELFQFHDVREDLPMNSSIGFIRAIDNDGHQVRYSIFSSEFGINEDSGEIYLLKPVDYDEDPSCREFLGVADDRNGGNSTCQVEICLQPINEFAPELRSESKVFYINVDNVSSIQLEAVDHDRSVVNALSFRFEKSPLCNLTFSANGTIFLPSDRSCLGILEMPISINDNDPSPMPKTTNEKIRFVFFSERRTLQDVLMKNNIKWSGQIITFIIIFSTILLIICIVLALIYQQHRKSTNYKRTHRNHLPFAEKRDLLSDALLRRSQIKLPLTTKVTLNSDSSSTYNDSCYGSSDIDSQAHHSPNQLNGKILLASNDNYIIFCKDPSTANEQNKNATSMNIEKNNNLISRYQTSKRLAVNQPFSSQIEGLDCRTILPSNSSFHRRNNTDGHEYYL